MLKKKNRWALITFSLLLSSLLIFAGCESADLYTVDVTPAYSDVTAVNQTVSLSASGWSDYTWSLSDNTIGSLSATSGESVIYTAKTIPPAKSSHLMQVVMVTAKSSAATSSTGTNSTTQTSYTGSAKIRHVSQGGSASGTTEQTITVTPATATHTAVGTFTVLEITAVSGYTYTWSISNTSIGSLSPTTGNKVTYSTTTMPSSGSQIQTITVIGTSTTSSTKYKGTSVITQKAE